MRAVLFDWDNTLVYAAPHQDQVAAEVLLRHGVQRTPREINNAFLKANVNFQPREHWEQFIGVAVAALGLAAGTAVAEDLAAAVAHAYAVRVKALFPDTAETLTQLRRAGLRLAVVSDNDRAHDQVREFGLDHLVELVVTPRDAGVKKPHPVLFRLAADRLAVAPAECLFVGDSYELDVMGARAAGMMTLLLDRFGLGSAEGRVTVADTLTVLLTDLSQAAD